MMYELPPILSTDDKENIKALREYLLRIMTELETAQSAQLEQSQSETAAPPQSTAAAVQLRREQSAAAKQNSDNLRSLIVKTAHTLSHSIDTLRESLHEDYLAISDFGSYAEQVTNNITATARLVVESYDFSSQLLALNEGMSVLDKYYSTLSGEIRRGIITDPDSGEQCMGIAISESLSFTGEVHDENGLSYYELSPGQTLGLYTSTGWQFWINGSKRGWFDSIDGMLHVRNIRVENALYLGTDWVLSSVGGFGIRYIGG